MKKYLLLILCFSALSLSAQITITEIMYNPPESGTDSTEFIELYNNSSTAVNLNGYMFSEGVVFTFPNYTLGAGQIVLIVKDSSAIINTYGGLNVDVFSWTSGSLGNVGENIVLVDMNGVTIDSVDYDNANSWPGAGSNGDGFSIVLCDINTNNNLGSNWLLPSISNATGIIVNGNEIVATPGVLGGCSNPGIPNTPCGDLYFSEYIEGSGNNKAIEIYNPTSNPIDLSDYEVQRFTNGSLTAGGIYTFPVGTMLANQDVYVIANSNAIASILTVSDTTNAAAFFNGDDAVALINVATGDTLDIIGEIGVDPGSGWIVGSGATNESTLVRKSFVNQGETDWSVALNQWDVFLVDMSDSLGGHTQIACGTASTPELAFSVTAQNVNENIGVITVDVNITNSNNTATTVDVILNTGLSSATIGADFTYTSPSIVTFAAGSNTSQSVTLMITDDLIQESLEAIVLELSAPTNGAIITSGTHTITIQDNELVPDFGNCSDLFFSEYIEGSSNNKALEIYNPTCNPIDLSDYEVQRFTNGSLTAGGTYTFPVGTMLANQDVYVIANSNAIATILTVSDTTNAAAFFNGDDAIALINVATGDTLDIIGEIGVDPGSGWIVGSGATNESTLVRKPHVHDGTSDWFTSVLQWDVFVTNVVDSLGAHTATACSTLPISISYIIMDTTTCLGDSTCFTNTSTGGACNISYAWDFGDGNSSSLENPCHLYTMAGSYMVNLIVSDGISTVDTTVNVIVNPSVDASINPVAPVCEIGLPITLTAADTGGIWSGTGITDINNGIFDPTTTSVGSYILNYTIAGVCGSTDSILINVVTDDSAAFEYLAGASGQIGVYCIGEPNPTAFVYGGATGTFSSTAGLVLDPNTGEIDMLASALGTFTVYFVTNAPCVNTDSVTVSIVSCSGVEEYALKVNIYPQPASDFMIIQGDLSEVTLISISDLNGRLITQIPLNTQSETTVDISNLSIGQYVLSLTTEKATSRQLIMIK